MWTRKGPSRKTTTTGTSKFRSTLEEVAAEDLQGENQLFLYERLKIKYTQPAKSRVYTPDFILPKLGHIYETKGRFAIEDRQKMSWVTEQYPRLDIRMVFSNARARISKVSKTTYGEWCEARGIPFAHQRIPREWLEEEPNLDSIDILEKILGMKALCDSDESSE